MAKARDFTVLLVRSCATEWDDCGRLVGSSDLPLCEAGRGRIEQALDAMGSNDLDVVLSSADESSVQIAELVAGSTNARVRVVESLSDVRLGLWEGLRANELAERYPTAFRQWQADPGSVQVPGGESFHAGRERIVDGLVRALEKVRSKDTRIGVVVRPMAWAVLRCWLGSMPSSRVWEVMREAPLLAWHEVDLEQLLSAAGSTDAES
ncbi:MAG: histidine phosphatase family protein [Leptolyngbya sp. PLA3]|nr:MAG: histidine phosphatase family protein [Cyanobacteria bacterium CYA]MCE7968392.1 histidine phosphatase family protein [Leptolyngbya sp. PL-A3]